MHCKHTPIPRHTGDLLRLPAAQDLLTMGVDPLALLSSSPLEQLCLASHCKPFRRHKDDRMFRMLKEEFRRDAYGLQEFKERDGRGATLDIGGHIGTAALMMHALDKHRLIHSFEPAPLNFFYLAWNAMLHNSTRLYIYYAGLTRDGGMIKIEYSPDDTTSTRRASLGHSWGTMNKLVSSSTTWSVGQLQECIDVPSTSLVKLDCEGCEFELLSPLRWLFLRSSVRVVGEFHHWHLSQPGHEANLSLNVAQTSMRILCNRNRSSDRIEWLKGC
jgi:FkbM family methyltransferase